jgi:cobalt/nickel transport system permease protein
MAHIPDGVLSTPVLIAGALSSATLIALSLRHLDYERLPQAAVLAAGFFVASLIQVPLGVTSVHLLLNGLMGLLLGWTAVPAILVALTLQAIFFGYGGLLVLGVNTLNMALPALVCTMVLTPHLRRSRARKFFWVGALSGFLGVSLTGTLVALSLTASGAAFEVAAGAIFFAYIPLAVVEALIAGTLVAFLRRVEPELLGIEEAPS